MHALKAHDRTAFPLFGAVDWLELTVRSGDCAYVPGFWWHHVTSLEPSIAASFWYPTLRHNPLWAETLLWALEDARASGPQPLFDLAAAPLPADACRGAATVSQLGSSSELATSPTLPPGARPRLGLGWASC